MQKSFEIKMKNVYEKVLSPKVLNRNDISKVEIAEKTNISRPKLNRIINKAQEVAGNSDKANDEVIEYLASILTIAETEAFEEWFKHKRATIERKTDAREKRSYRYVNRTKGVKPRKTKAEKEKQLKTEQDAFNAVLKKGRKTNGK